MTKIQQVETAKEKIDEAIEILENINNGSLEEYYGYSIKLMIQELEKVSDNRSGYLTRDSNIEEIIESVGENWEDEEIEVAY